MTKVSDIFSEKSVKEEVFVETEILEEVSTAKATKKNGLILTKGSKRICRPFSYSRDSLGTVH